MAKLSKTQLAKLLRDSLHNFVMEESNELDNDAYFTRLQCFIETLEGSRCQKYLRTGLNIHRIQEKSFFSID